MRFGDAVMMLLTIVVAALVAAVIYRRFGKTNDGPLRLYLLKLTAAKRRDSWKPDIVPLKGWDWTAEEPRKFRPYKPVYHIGMGRRTTIVIAAQARCADDGDEQVSEPIRRRTSSPSIETISTGSISGAICFASTATSSMAARPEEKTASVRCTATSCVTTCRRASLLYSPCPATAERSATW